MVSYILLSSPPEKLDLWTFQFFPSPQRNWELEFFIVCSCSCWAKGRGNVIRQPKSPISVLTCPQKAGVCRSHQHSRQASQKAILWPTPRRGGDIRCLDKLFLPREKAAMGFSYSFCSELKGGAMSSICPSCHLYSPQATRLCQTLHISKTAASPQEHPQKSQDIGCVNQLFPSP